MDTTTTTAALADLFGVDVRTVSDLAKRDIIVRAARSYALVESVRGYCGHLRDLATGRGGESAISSGTTERARLARAQADLTETKVHAMRGELVPAANVEAEWSSVLGTVRSGMLAVSSRAAQRLPHLTPHDVAEIDAEIRCALMEISTGNPKE